MASTKLCMILFVFLFHRVQARLLGISSHDTRFVSNGIDTIQSNQSPALSLASSTLSAGVCEHIYGFFPCADTIPGYLYQIVLYQYLLIVGEKLVNKGSQKLFNILDTGIFGASIFRVLTALPGLIMSIISGVLTTEEGAQRQVSLAVSTNAGSVALNLTLLWGICVIFGRREIPKNSNSTSQQAESSVSQSLLPKKKVSTFKDTGVSVDTETSRTAWIMLLSVVPFIIILLVNGFNTASGKHRVILITLVVTSVMLLSYFIYQVLNPAPQRRSLEYSKYENLLGGFLDYMQREAKGNLIDQEGQPNVTVIGRLFAQTDRDKNKRITVNELENFVLGIYSRKGEVDKDFARIKALEVFDLNKDGMIGEREFYRGCTAWIEEALQFAEDDDSPARKHLSEVVEQSKQKRMDQILGRLMSRILKHVDSQASEGQSLLIADDGSPNIDRIKEVFSQFDTNNNKFVSRFELEKFIRTIRFGRTELSVEEIVKIVMEEFDEDRNGKIDEDEFVRGMKQWIMKAMSEAKTEEPKASINEFDKIMWGDVEESTVNKKHERNRTESLIMLFSKAAFEVILGIAILTFCGAPLMISILQLSDELGILFIVISFVILPVAMNARRALSAISTASRGSKTASLTFSEIYGRVVMNNIMGMTTLLAIIYAKELAWTYSAEVLIALVICVVMGLLAVFRTVYPLWTGVSAILLYPLSVLSYYVLHNIWDQE